MSAILREVAEILAQHGDLRCVPSVDADERAGCLVLRVEISGRTLVSETIVNGRLDALELFHALRYLQDLASLRALAAKYDIDPARLEALLPKERL